MKTFAFRLAALAASLAAAFAAPAHAQIVVSEAAPYASGNTAYAADWFELTNTGSTAVDISGWKIDDSSASFGAAVALRGVTSIGAGQSVIFLEGLADGSTDSTIAAGFLAAWFGGSTPAGLLVGGYGGSGIGLSTGGDALNLFNAAGALVTAISFGVADAASPYSSFDNTLGLTGVPVALMSAVGVNGAFLSSSGVEIGSPGILAAVPEPMGLALLAAGLGVIGSALRRRR